MRVVMPYTASGVSERAVAALREQFCPGAEFVIRNTNSSRDENLELRDVSASPTAYWRLLRDLWSECAENGDDLLLVEQAVVIAPGAIGALDACPEPWCSCPAFGWRLCPKLDGGTRWTAAYLQANRFRSEFIREHADALDLPMMERGWWQLDTYFLGRLPARCHLHLGLSQHRRRSIAEIRERQRESIAWKAAHPSTPLLAAVYRLGVADDDDAHLRLALGKRVRQAVGDDAALAVLTADDPHAALAELAANDARAHHSPEMVEA